MEPERPIEKLLRDIARKRRDEAGQPFELHPATRRQLQGEVARRRLERGDRGVLATILSRIQPRFAFAICVAGVLALCAIIILPALSESKSRSQLASKSDAFKQTEAREPSGTPAPPGQTVTPAEEVATRNVPARPLPAVIDATGAREAVGAEWKKTAGVTQTSLGLSLDATGVGGTSPPAAAPPRSLSVDELASVPSRGQVLADAETKRQQYNRTQESAGRARETPVLRSFSVEHSDGELRFVDADGSIYRSTPERSDFASGIVAAETSAAPAAEAFRYENAKPPADGSRLYPFAVAGSNRTLGQWVVFNGSFSNGLSLSESGKLKEADAASNSVLNTETQNLPWLSWLNWTITGTATVAGTNQLEIRAEPTRPLSSPR